MTNIEKLLQHMKDSAPIRYPDFDRMWSAIQESRQPARRKIPFKKTAFILLTAVVLASAPVYASINWGQLFPWKSGIQSALNQGLGQDINQSVTVDGITLTLHTAVVDENQTVILYSFDSDTDFGGTLGFESMTLLDEQGQPVEGRFFSRYDLNADRYYGYFQTDWIPQNGTVPITFTAHNAFTKAREDLPISYDPFNTDPQTFSLDIGGLDTVTVQSFRQDPVHIIVTSSFRYTEPEIWNKVTPRLEAMRNQEIIPWVGTTVLYTPGDPGEFMNRQMYKMENLQDQQTTFVISYDRVDQRWDADWSFHVVLNGTEMRNSTIVRELDNVLLEVGDETLRLEKMTITPSQIKLEAANQEYFSVFHQYKLDVGGTVLSGGKFPEPNSSKTTFRFQFPSDVRITDPQVPVTLIAKHLTVTHDGGDVPIRLTEISEKPQTLETDVGGFPVTWTYYMSDGSLYVQSVSADPEFGGVNQTYQLNNGKRVYGQPANAGVMGDGVSFSIDKYPNFTGQEVELYIWKYSTEHPEKEVRVPLQ